MPDPYAVVGTVPLPASASGGDPYAVVGSQPIGPPKGSPEWVKARLSQAFSPEAAAGQVSGLEHGLNAISGLDPNKSLYENFRNVGPKALTLGVQMIPGVRALGALSRIAVAAGTGAATEFGGQTLDTATGHPGTQTPGPDVAGAAISAGATEAIPAAAKYVAQKVFRPAAPLVSKAYDIVEAKIGDNRINPTELQNQAKAFLSHYDEMSSGLPRLSGVNPNAGSYSTQIAGPGGKLQAALEDAAMGQPLTFRQTDLLKEELSKAADLSGSAGGIAKQMLKTLEASREALAASSGALEDYRMAKTLYMAKEAHDSGLTAKLTQSANPIVSKVFSIPGAAAQVASTTTDHVVQRLMLDPKWQPEMERLLVYLHDGKSSAVGPLLTRMVINVAKDKLQPALQ